MAEPFRDRARTELKRGVLQVAVLAQLRARAYGYDLVRTLNEGGIATEEGTVYPILRRLEAEGLLASTWDTTGSRPRKYYHTTPEGIDVLHELVAEWSRVHGCLLALLGDSPEIRAATESGERQTSTQTRDP